MASSRRSGEVDRACLSPKGESISLFANNVDSLPITEKITNLDCQPIRKEDGCLSDKICKKCIYLAELVERLEKKLLSIDTSLRMLRVNEQGSLPEQSLIIEESDDSEATVHDELDNDIVWISNDERNQAEAAVGRKQAKGDKDKLENRQMSIYVAKTKTVPLMGIENKIIEIDLEKREARTKLEATDDIDEAEERAQTMKKKATKNEEPKESMKTEDVCAENFPEYEKKIVNTEKIDNFVVTKKFGNENNAEGSKIKINPNVIIISDSSDDDDDYPDNRRKAPSALATNSSGLIGNENTSRKSTVNTETQKESRIAVHSDKILGPDWKKGSSSLRAENARKISATGANNQVHESQERSLSCRVCNERFSTKTDFFVHFNLHKENDLFRWCCNSSSPEHAPKNDLPSDANDRKNRDRLSQLEASESEKRAKDHPKTGRQNGNVKIDTAICGETREVPGKGVIVTGNLPISVDEKLDDKTMNLKKNSAKEKVISTDNSAVPIVENADKNRMKHEQKHGANNKNITIVSDNLDESDSSDNPRKVGKTSNFRAANARKRRAEAALRMFFYCEVCGVNLHTVPAALLHYYRLHDPQADSMLCRMCNSRCSSKTALLTHFKYHTARDLFRCPYCLRKFVLKDNLTRHMKDHKKRDCPWRPKDSCKRRRLDTEIRRTARQLIEKRDKTIRVSGKGRLLTFVIKKKYLSYRHFGSADRQKHRE